MRAPVIPNHAKVRLDTCVPVIPNHSKVRLDTCAPVTANNFKVRLDTCAPVILDPWWVSMMDMRLSFPTTPRLAWTRVPAILGPWWVSFFLMVHPSVPCTASHDHSPVPPQASLGDGCTPRPHTRRWRKNLPGCVLLDIASRPCAARGCLCTDEHRHVCLWSGGWSEGSQARAPGQARNSCLFKWFASQGSSPSQRQVWQAGALRGPGVGARGECGRKQGPWCACRPRPTMSPHKLCPCPSPAPSLTPPPPPNPRPQQPTANPAVVTPASG